MKLITTQILIDWCSSLPFDVIVHLQPLSWQLLSTTLHGFLLGVDTDEVNRSLHWSSDGGSHNHTPYHNWWTHDDYNYRAYHHWWEDYYHWVYQDWAYHGEDYYHWGYDDWAYHGEDYYYGGYDDRTPYDCCADGSLMSLVLLRLGSRRVEWKFGIQMVHDAMDWTNEYRARKIMMLQLLLLLVYCN